MPRKRLHSRDPQFLYRNMHETSGLPGMAGRSRLGLKATKPVTQSVTTNPFEFTATISGKAKQTGSVNVAHGTYTLITFNSEVHDNAGMVNLATNNDRITITRSGYYMLTAEITFQTNTTGNRQVLISKNGGPHPAGTLLTAPAVRAITTQTHVLTATQAELVVGDYLTLGAYHDAGVTLGVGGSHGDTNLTVTMLGFFE